MKQTKLVPKLNVPNLFYDFNYDILMILYPNGSSELYHTDYTQRLTSSPAYGWYQFTYAYIGTNDGCSQKNIINRLSTDEAKEKIWFICNIE